MRLIGKKKRMVGVGKEERTHQKGDYRGALPSDFQVKEWKVRSLYSTRKGGVSGKRGQGKKKKVA